MCSCVHVIAEQTAQVSQVMTTITGELSYVMIHKDSSQSRVIVARDPQVSYSSDTT